MAEVTPAVLAESPQAYEHDLQLAVSLSSRIQIDLVDGEFAENKTINLVQAHWPQSVRADIHLMYHHPESQLETVLATRPHLFIVHAEAEGLDLPAFMRIAEALRPHDIRLGLALLAPTQVETVRPLLAYADHVLVFTGELGHYGGVLDSSCLDKISEIKALYPDMEVGVDGGINDETIATVLAAGADVCNVGSFLQRADDPQAAYATLTREITA